MQPVSAASARARIAEASVMGHALAGVEMHRPTASQRHGQRPRQLQALGERGEQDVQSMPHARRRDYPPDSADTEPDRWPPFDC